MSQTGKAGTASQNGPGKSIWKSKGGSVCQRVKSVKNRLECKHDSKKNKKKTSCCSPVRQICIINTPIDTTLNINLYYNTITTNLDKINLSEFDTFLE